MYLVPNFEPVHCSISSSNCGFLPCIQVSQEAGMVVWYSYFIKNISQFVVIHTVKGFSIVNKVYVFHDPVDVGNLIPGSSAFSKSSLYIWKFSVHVFLKSNLKILSISLLVIGCNCTATWTFFGIALLWDWNENWLFPVFQWPLPSLSNLLAYWMQQFNSIIF